jgi:peptide/nickel transport system substrate-binding protein
VQSDESSPNVGPTNDDDARLTRGAFLKRGAGGAAALGALPLVMAACGGSSASPATSAASTSSSGPIRRGGQLRVGLVGGGTAETLNPYLAITPIDQSRIQNLYDPLVLVNSDMSRSPGLALEWNPNKDATVWEVKLRPDVTFWNGKSFGAQDVIYSIGLMAAKTSAGLPFVSGINLNEMKAVNQHLVRIPLKFPDADLSANFTYYNTWIVQDGEKDFTHPVGTGPFELESFTPGQQSIFKRNPNYWVSGKPYIDSLKYISISDPTARLNALLSGQIDAMAQLPYQEAKAHQSVGDINVLAAKSPQPYMFYMDTTRAPFSNNNVRQAMRLIADRPALIESAISGYGTLGNDLVGKGLQWFDDSIPQRTQDIEKAKSLLKSAGQQNLSVLLQTSPIFPGFVEAATLLAQQATAAGVKINLKQEPASSYYNPSILYLKMAFAQTQWAVPSIKFFYLQSLAANAPYNETHWHSTSFNNLLFKAIGELDKTKAQQYWNQIQQIQWTQGGYLLWTNADWVDGLSTKVRGLAPSAASALGNYLFRNVWLAT